MRFNIGDVSLTASGAGPLVVTDFDPGDHQLRTDDVEVVGRPGSIPARDVDASRMWQFSVLAVDDESGSALGHVAELSSAWRPPELLQPGVLVPLRYQLADRWRRVYGRPGQITAPDARFVEAGQAEVDAAFRVLDARYYDDDEDSIDIGIVPASSAGLIFPATPPFTWRSAGEPRSRWANVGGDTETPLVVTFQGPVTRPWIRVGTVVVELTGTLAYDVEVTVDARTRRVTRGDGASAASMLSPQSRLSDLTLPPGQHEVTFGGTDETGTATARVSWRSAWQSI